VNVAVAAAAVMMVVAIGCTGAVSVDMADTDGYVGTPTPVPHYGSVDVALSSSTARYLWDGRATPAPTPEPTPTPTIEAKTPAAASQAVTGAVAGGVYGLIQQIFPEWAWSKAYRVAMCESNGNAGATGSSGERGYFQIHPVHFDSTYDPVGNVRAAYRISSGGSDWSAWTCQ
jgi:hypothetical protein